MYEIYPVGAHLSHSDLLEAIRTSAIYPMK